MDRFVKLRNVSLEPRKKRIAVRKCVQKNRQFGEIPITSDYLLCSLTSDNRRTSNARVVRENVNFC